MSHDRGGARTLILLGGGGHAAVVADSAQTAGWTVVGYLDDERPSDESAPPMRATPALPHAHLGRLGDLVTAVPAHAGVAVHAAVGDETLRRRWLDRVDLLRDEGVALVETATIVHASAVVSASAEIGVGCFVGPNAVINARARLERGVIVNSGAIVEHDCTLGAFAHVAPGAVLAGAVTIGEDTLIGVGAAVHPGVRVGRAVALGAGAVAVSDIPDGARAVGVPARAT